MCGIVGIYCYHNKIDNRISYIKKCLTTMAHRGPDAEGIWHNNKNYITGFVRLAIRDLSMHGNQPMVSDCGNYCISFNGEIYNAGDFKWQLEKKGVRFKSTSDSEILLYALIHLGVEKVLAEFDGMYAFAFYDLQKNELIVARDRLGIKPLYIGFDKQESIIFSSQYDHVINYASLRNEVLDYEAIGSYLQLGYVSANMGAVKNTVLFPHGHYAVINERGYLLKRYAFNATCIKNDNRLLNESFFYNATQQQLVSDVTLGTFLSGGVDSSLISFWANQHQAVKAFTIGSNGHFTDEREAAASFARAFQIPSSIHEIKEQDLLKLIMDNVEAYSEPFSDFSSIPALMLSGFARQSVKVILSGDGPDEMFWGYDRNLKFLEAGKKYFTPRLKLLFEMASSKLMGTKILINRRMLKSKDFFSFYYESLFLYGSRLVPSIYKPRCKKAFALNLLLEQYGNKDPSECYMHIVRDLEMNIHLQRILLKIDRASMYHSLEVRVPFLSNKIVEAAFSSGHQQHIKNGSGKYFLKNILSGKLNADYAFKPKKGFSVPMAKWLRESIRMDVEEKIWNMPVELKIAFNQKQLERLLFRHMETKEDFSGIIWALYSLVNWYEYHRKNSKLLS